jgi:hypothetical protein
MSDMMTVRLDPNNASCEDASSILKTLAESYGCEGYVLRDRLRLVKLGKDSRCTLAVPIQGLK